MATNSILLYFLLRVYLDLTMIYSLSDHVLHYRNTDKMSDEEKLPIALAGLAGISLPFIFGMIALYAAQG